MKLSQLHDMMKEFNYRVVDGGECEAWGDFVNDCYRTYGIGPWDDLAPLTYVDNGFADYWAEVSRADINGATEDYDSSGRLRRP